MDNLDSLIKLTLFIFLWIGMILLQTLYIVIFVLWAIVVPLLSILWICLGSYLLQTKVLSKILFGIPGYVWYRVAFDSSSAIDMSLLHGSIFFHFIVQALPRICIQATNSFLKNKLNPVTIFSLTLSFLTVINGLYKYGYYTLC